MPIHSFCNYIDHKHSFSVNITLFAALPSENLAPAVAGTITGMEGSEIILRFQTSCAVFNLSVYSFQWLFSEMNLTTNDSSLEIADDSSTRYKFSSDMLSLTISDLSAADAGYYTLTLNTSVTVLQATIYLVVQGKVLVADCILEFCYIITSLLFSGSV